MENISNAQKIIKQKLDEADGLRYEPKIPRWQRVTATILIAVMIGIIGYTFYTVYL